MNKALDDITLVSRVTVLADKRAFDQLVRRYQSQVRRYFVHLTLGNKQLSDDLAQDTFVKAYQNIAKFKALSSFSTWLYRIAYNIYCDYVRKQRSTEDIEEVKCISSSSVEGLRLDIIQALSVLKEEERTCITLQLIEGQPIDRIAEITAMPTGTVKSHLSRGKEKLTTYLKKNGYGRR